MSEFKVNQSDWWVDRIEIIKISNNGEQSICEIENESCDSEFLSEKLSFAFQAVAGLENMARDEYGRHLEDEYHIVIKSMPHHVGPSHDQ